MKILNSALLLTLSFCSSAETDNFDMTLSGSFEKDFCQINISNPSPSFTLDFSSVEPRENTVCDGEMCMMNVGEGEGGSLYLFENIETGTSQSVTCSAGTYNTFLWNNDYGYLNIPGLVEYGAITQVHTRIYHDGTLWMDTPVNGIMYEGGALVQPNVTIDTDRELVRYEYYFSVGVGENAMPFLAESFTSPSSEYIIVIDKID